MLEICEASEDNPFIHGMSKQFVNALQQLFDVMDTNNSGTIKYCDIAVQWEEDQSDPFFPKGLVSCLAKVTLQNGLLTFDRFCAGIKLCLLKNQVEINGDFIQDGDFNLNHMNHDDLINPATDNGIDEQFSHLMGREFELNVPPVNLNRNNELSTMKILQTKIQPVASNAPRPPSEPSIFAPPPPPPQSQPPVGSLNDSLTNITNQTQTESANTTPSTSAGTTTASSESDDSVNSPVKKKHPKLPKRPLPTYEQVMAAKNSLKPTGLLNKITGIHEQDDEQPCQNPIAESKSIPQPLNESSEITVNSLMLTLPPKNFHNNAGNNGVSKLFVKPTTLAPPTHQPFGTNHSSNYCEQNQLSPVLSQNYPQNLYENFNTLTSLTRAQITNSQQQQQNGFPHHNNHLQSTIMEPIYGQRAKSMTNLDSIARSNHNPNIISPIGNRTKEFENNQLLPEFSAPLSQRSKSMEQNSKSSHNLLNISTNQQKFLSQNQLQSSEPTNNQPNTTKSGQGSANTSLPKTLSRNYIMKTLQNWRDNILQHSSTNSKSSLVISSPQPQQQQQQQQQSPPQQPNIVSPNSKKAVNIPVNVSAEINTNGLPIPPPKPPLNRAIMDTNLSLLKKRREPRRHTVGANGIDIYTVKRYHLLEQEKDILLRGLGEVEKTKDWFVRQISGIQDKINLVGRGQAVGVVGPHIIGGGGGNDCNIDAYQERINFQAARIGNLNQHMNTMREYGQNFPLHMNLAFRPFNAPMKIDPNSPKQLVINPNLVNKLKDQNRLLTEEVGRKGERITQLEREKASLIRELFQARTYASYYGNGTDFDDTLM